MTHSGQAIETARRDTRGDSTEAIVMLVDDYQPVRESLRLFLEHVVGVATVRETG